MTVRYRKCENKKCRYKVKTTETYFTLIEIMVTVSIMILLAAASLPIARAVWIKNAESKTRYYLGVIDNAANKHYELKGYPPQVIPLPATTDIPGHYLKESDLISWGMKDLGALQIEGDYVVDYFKNPIRYRAPGIMNPQRFDLWSAGVDGVDGNGTGDLSTALTRLKDDDINNWRQ